MTDEFKVGVQPCQNFLGDYGPGYLRVHCCYKCDGTVSFCGNCHFDHHAGGKETCVPKPPPSDDDKEPVHA